MAGQLAVVRKQRHRPRDDVHHERRPQAVVAPDARKQPSGGQEHAQGHEAGLPHLPGAAGTDEHAVQLERGD